MPASPKLIEVVGASLDFDVQPWWQARHTIWAIEAAGYTIIATKTLESRERALVRAQQGAAATSRELVARLAWAREGHAEARHLRDRCTFLYQAAIAAGATPEDLRQD